MICPLEKITSLFPHLTAIRRQHTFSQLNQEATQIEKRLIQIGIRPGDLILCRLQPSPYFIALFFATWRLGASIFPLSPHLPEIEVAKLLETLSPKCWISSEGVEIIRKVHKPIPFTESSVVLLTSGSSGIPKKAVISLQNLIANAREVISFVRLQPADAWKLNLPLYHVSGIGIMIRSILAGATIVLDGEPEAITHISMVPTQLYRNNTTYPRLTCLLLGGAPLPSSLHPFPIYRTYGLTEMSSSVTIASDQEKDPSSMGFALPNRMIKIASDGEVYVKGSSLFQGYWEENQIKHPCDQDGWFHTNDVGEMTPQGLKILGRKDFQFISGGENIQPEEIERILHQFPSVEDAVVIPIDDPEFGKIPIAAIQSKTSTFEEHELKKFLIDRLPKFKIPKKIIYLSEFPKINSKIDRKNLKNQISRIFLP